MKYSKLLPVFFALTFISCKNESSSSQNTTVGDGLVTVEEFSNLLKSENQLIDVRTPEEFAEGYIAKAKNIDFRDEAFEAQIATLDKSKAVLVYCKSGGRSGKTYSLLKSKGFDKVYDLKGGFMAWSNANKPFSK